MTALFKDAVKAATALARAGKPAEATRMLQEALSAQDIETAAPKRARVLLPIGQTIAKLRALKLPGARTARPENPHFRQFQYTGPAGSRPYKLHLPPVSRGSLVIMLHGCGQDADDFAAGTRMNALADEHGLVVIYPQQVGAANQASCWNWFQPSDQGAGRGEPAIIAGIVEQAIAEHDIDRAKVFAAGLSAGGAMAAILGAAYPDLFSAVGVHSGLPVGAASDVGSAFAAMQNGPAGTRKPSGAVRTIVFHGSADTTVHPSNGGLVARDALAVLGARGRETAEEGRSAGGRSFTRRVVHDGNGRPAVEHWQVDGAGHAWSGGDRAGSFTDPSGPDASAEMIRFFLAD